MSDFSENKQNELEPHITDDTVSNVDTEKTEAEESTVFSAPVEHKDKAPKNTNKKRLISIIAACLSVAILIGGTIAVIKLIPELKEDEITGQAFEDIAVLDRDSSTFTAVNITNTNGTFKFITKQITATNENNESETTTYWGVEDIDISKMSTDAMNSVISSAASITAIREIDTKAKEECGFDDPRIKVSVEDDTNGSFGFTVGDPSTDGLGYYFIMDDSDTIYVVPSDELSDFQFKLVDLADKTAIPATTFDTDTSENKAEDGSYAYFDSLTLAGTLYSDTVTIENNKEDGSSAEVIPYIITTPTKRYGNTENISNLISLFSATVNVAGNYAFDINDQTLKEFGLDNPDAVLTMTINGESKTFKISLVDSEYCAVIYDGATMIRKVTASSFAFLSQKSEDFYNKHPFMYSINDISGLELVDGEDIVKFDISYTEDSDSNITYDVKVNGTQIVASDFQTFYADFVGTQCSNFTVVDTSEEALSSVKFTFHTGSVVTIDFYKINETEYQYSVNDAPMGRITSAAYKKMIRNVKAQAEAVETE